MWSCTDNKTKFLTKSNKTKFLTNYKKTNNTKTNKTNNTKTNTAIIKTITIIMIIVAIKNNCNRTERSSNYGKCIFFITIKTAISLAS